MIRPEVADFIALGTLPSEDDEPDEALEARVDRAADLLELVERPVTDEEAQALAACFGHDECFGVAWRLLHLVETAPRAPEAAQRRREGLTR